MEFILLKSSFKDCTLSLLIEALSKSVNNIVIPIKIYHADICTLDSITNLLIKFNL